METSPQETNKSPPISTEWSDHPGVYGYDQNSPSRYTTSQPRGRQDGASHENKQTYRDDAFNLFYDDLQTNKDIPNDLFRQLSIRNESRPEGSVSSEGMQNQTDNFNDISLSRGLSSSHRTSPSLSKPNTITSDSMERHSSSMGRNSNGMIEETTTTVHGSGTSPLHQSYPSAAASNHNHSHSQSIVQSTSTHHGYQIDQRSYSNSPDGPSGEGAQGRRNYRQDGSYPTGTNNSNGGIGTHGHSQSGRGMRNNHNNSSNGGGGGGHNHNHRGGGPSQGQSQSQGGQTNTMFTSTPMSNNNMNMQPTQYIQQTLPSNMKVYHQSYPVSNHMIPMPAYIEGGGGVGGGAGIPNQNHRMSVGSTYQTPTMPNQNSTYSIARGDGSSVNYTSVMLSQSQPVVTVQQPLQHQHQQVYPGHTNMIMPSNPNPMQYNYTGYSVGGWDQHQQPIVVSYSMPQQQMLSMQPPNQHNSYNNDNNNMNFDDRNGNGGGGGGYSMNSNNLLSQNKQRGMNMGGMGGSGMDINNNNNNNRQQNSSKRRTNSDKLSKAPTHQQPPMPTTLPSINEIRGNVRALSKEQLGCRVLQQILEAGDVDIREVVMQESTEILNEILVDAFGNYLFQKLMEYADEDRRVEMLTTVQHSLLNASLNLHGTRSVQRTVEICCHTKQEIDLLVGAFRQNTVRLCMDQNGNHVIQKCLVHFPPEDYSFIFHAVTSACLEVCTQRHGCCVVQRCLDASREAQGITHTLGIALSDEVIRNAVPLMQHQYGNYVVQYVMDMGTGDEIRRICLLAAPLIVPLSLQKFASNVIEKCLKKGPSDMQGLLIDELTYSNRLPQLLEDQFGNYVVQSALDAVPHNVGLRLVEALKPHLVGLRNTSGGRRIMAKLVKNYSLVLFDAGMGNLVLDDNSSSASANAAISELWWSSDKESAPEIHN
eukprot:gene4221-8399_t